MNNLSHIEKFLNKHGFSVKEYTSISIKIDFLENSEVYKAQEEYARLRKEAENTDNEELQDSLYRNSWEIINNAQKEFLPKLQVISDSINSFYQGRKSAYRSLIFLNFSTFELISISANEDLYDYFKNDNSLLLEIEKEFQDFDSFLINYNQ